MPSQMGHFLTFYDVITFYVFSIVFNARMNASIASILESVTRI